MKITIVVGTRPNFVKVAPLIRSFKKVGINSRLIHTGQHYDDKLSGNFFEDLDIPNPDTNFNVRSGTQSEQTGNIMLHFEQELRNNRPDFVLVVGDVNSSMACAIVAKKENLPLIHVEAGLRSRDLQMPEEINRIIIDRISDICFTTTKEASETLINEGFNPTHIHFVGNVMIDSLDYGLSKLQKPSQVNLPEKFFVLTLHRPTNVDEKNTLTHLLDRISQEIDSQCEGIFPVHPRTLKSMDGYEVPKNISIIPPMGYLEFIYSLKNAVGVITDSGGIQEETTYLGTPCLTLRENTERPETITIGTNELIGVNNLEKLGSSIQTMIKGEWKKAGIPELWDGNAADRISKILLSVYNKDK